MKFKKEIIAIILILCMLFTISAISAADGATDVVSATNASVEAANENVAGENNLAIENNGEILGETDGGTYSELSQKITNPSGTTVDLWNNYTFDSTSSAISISTANLVIDGHGVTTIDANGYSSIFKVAANGVTIKNIKFINGYSTDSDTGGAISSTEKSVNIENCTFIDNQASSAGAIYTYYASSSIKDCTFINNKGSTAGAIFWEYAWGTIEKCIFINNTGNTAGAISVYSWYATNIKNSIFVNNAGGNEIYGYQYWYAINANYNWFGTIIDNYETNAPNVNDDVTLGGYYVLNFELDNDNGKAKVSLNNLYESGVLNTNYDAYELPPIDLNVKGKNIVVENSVSLVDGAGTIEFTPVDAYAITVNYNSVELIREVKPTFSMLKDKINSEGNEISLDQDYVYDSAKDSGLTNGIDFAKDVTIDGQGHVIDAKESSNIFYFNDNTDSYSLTLKNIIFANATGTDGAAVYFKGKKIEIINCTFINNAATSQGDAVYVADASSNENKIVESLFTGNTGSNSVVYVNLAASSSKLNLNNSIFVGNDATYNVKGTSNVIVDYNWWGNTIENYNDNNVAKVDGVTLNNWLFLKIDATAVITGIATLSLNNFYNSSVVTTYDEYSLKPLTFTLSGSNARTSVSSITLDDNGRATYQFRMYKTTASLTATHESIATTKELEYTIVDDGSFKALNDIIWFSSANEVIELTHDYVYSESDTITEGIVIPRTITINGTGHKIDAKGETRIFDINGGVNNVNINDVNFVNANSTYGSVIIIRYGADYCNIKNCNFSNNTATSYAGAIDCIGDYCTIDNCNFINNTAVSKAGAIRYYHDTQAYIKNSNFINNTVEEGGSGGGAIYGDDGKVSIDKSSFFNNSAKNMLGGAIYSKKAITISDSIILNSTGNYDIYDTSGITIQNSWVGNTFDNYNSAPNVYYLSSSSWLYLNIKFYEDFAIVSLNEAYSTSSGSSSVYSNYNLPEITLNINSTSLDLGGINKITLDGNGKAIVPYTKLSEDAKLTVSNEYVSLTKDCKIGDFDSLQYLIDTATGDTVELTRNYTFIENVDTLTNGISITRDITIDGKGLTINGSNLARILYITTNGVTLKNINFVDGYATHGGAIYNNGGSGFKLINCTFENNVAYNNPGGAIYTYSNGVNDFINCTFIGNKMTKANQFGGAVYIDEVSGQNNFIGCAFINNTAHYGGAIATASGKAITNIEKSVFVTNTANAYSSIYIKGGTSAEFYLKNSIIFSKGFTTDSSTQVYVASTLGAGDVNYNWWMHTGSNYPQNLYVRFSGVGLSVTKYLFLEIGCENEMATISLNNVYDTSSRTTSVYDEELPQITFDLSAVNAIVDSDVTLNKNGQGEVGCDLTDQSGSLTATYNSVSITTSLTSDDSFTTLQGKINRALEGSELVLYHDYNYDSTKDAALAEGIVIDKDLTIDGQGYAIDAKNAARIFKIDDNTKNIVLKNIKFVNAVADNGAAVYANCNNIEIVNCTFENNQATANGDALYLVTNGCEITESTFINNIGTVSTIYLDSELDHAPINIVNSILVNNDGTNIVKSTKVDLTADYNWWGNTVDNTNDLSEGLAQKWYVLDMTVDDTKSIASISLNNLNDGTSYENYALPTITLNMQATNGAVRKDEITLDENGDATVGYLATADGATLTVSYNGVSITREIFYNEESDYSLTALKKIIDQANENDVITLKHDYEYVMGVDDAITAGIDITKNNLTIDGNGHILDAKEQTRIFNVGEPNRIFASNVTIKNTTFVNGKMSGQGGAIRWNGWNGTLFNCTFENNSATNNGGAVYWNGQYGNVTNCTFKNNVISGYYNGGAIYINTKNVNVFNSTFIENKASNGGSISISDDNVTVINSTFIKNTASNGGAIFVGNGNKIMSNVIINNSTFTSNQANTYGGAVDLSSGNNIHIVDSTFEGNKAGSHGGAIFSNAKFNVTNSTFKGNKANSNGGVLYYDNSAGGTIYNATFIDNSANKGGVIYTYAGIVDINQTDFINNYAQGSSAYGGVIYDQSSDKLSIENSNFTGNYVKTTTSTAYGGVIYSGYGDIIIANSTFNRNSIDSNSGSTYGSVIWFGNSAKGEIINTSFLNNHGKLTYAPAMYGTGSGVKVNVTNSIFLNNTYGSNTLKVVHSYSSAVFNFTDCWFGHTKKNSGEDMGTTTGSTITYNNKLELATVHEEYMVVGEDRQIKFVFQYADNGKLLIYDSSKLPKVNLTLSSVNGNLDKNSASMDETILFNANQFGSASITAKYNGIELTEELYAKDKPTITVEPIVVHVTETVGVNFLELIPSSDDLLYSAIDGDEFILVLSNGYVAGLKEGTSTLYINFNGNDDYAPTTVEVPVTVIKYTTGITTNLTESEPVNSITVDWGADSQNIIIGFDSGNPNLNHVYPDEYDVFTIKYRSNDTSVATVSVVDQKPIINFHSAGTANVTFYFEGNEKYYASEKNITVTVGKVASDVTVDPVEVSYGSTKTSTVTVDGATGVTTTLYDGDNEITGVVSVDGYLVTVNAANLDVGTYTLSVTTNPDYNHTSVTKTANVVVGHAGSDVSVPVSSSVTYGSSVTVTVTDLVNASGVNNAALYKGDVKVKDLVVNDGVNVVVDATSLNVGIYTLKVSTVPVDGNHASVTREGSVVVNKAGSDVTVPVFSEVTYGGSVDVNVVIPDGGNASGVTAKLYSNDVEITNVVTVDGLKVTVDASSLNVGTYTLKVSTVPVDGNHASVTREGSVVVNKAGSDVTVPVFSEVTYGGSVDVNVVIPDGGNASGVTAKLYSNDVEVPNVVSVDGLKVTVDATSLDVGTYALKVSSIPVDGNHASVTKDVSVVVNQAGSDVTVPVSASVTYGSSVIVTVTDLVNASGVDNAALYVGDVKVKDLVVNDGVNVVVDASGVDNGTYTLKVSTVPVDGNHASVTREGSILVNKAGSDVTVPVFSEVTYGSSVDISVVIPDGGNASGVIAKLYSNDVEIADVITVDGLKVTVDATSLDVGTYVLKVTAVTDANHAAITKEGSVVVNQAGSEVTVPAASEVDYQSSVDVNVVIPDGGNASGVTVKLYSNDVEVPDVVSVDGLKVTVDATALDVGTYTLKVTTIPNNANYFEVTRESLITVNKIDSEVIFSNEIVFAYEDEGSTIATCTGCTIDKDNIYILNHPEAVIRLEGNKITVSGLIEDEYTMKVITTPDKNHKSIETTLKVTVSGISPKMEMQVTNITVGEKETVFITMGTEATGIVNITILQGNEIIQTKNITINNRFNKTEFTGLKVGEYTITAHYYGTLNYNVVTIPDEFKVHPIYSLEFSAEVDDTVCGNTTNAIVNLSSDATGSIQIGSITEAIVGPQTVIELPVQNIAGKNNVTVKYIPDKDSKYGAQEIVVYYNVAKKSTEITISDITGKKVGDDVTIVASAYSGADVVLYVNGEKLDSNVIENIAAGTYTIVANVAETSQYLGATANKTFTVSKYDVDVSISGTPTKVGEKSTVTIVTDADEGVVVLNVNGTEYSVDISVSKSLDVVMPYVGSAPLTAKFLENYKYNAKDAEATTIVVSDKEKSNIVVQIPENIKVGDVVTINVTTPNDKLEVTVNGEKQTVTGGKITFTASQAGIYNIVAHTNETVDIFGETVFKSFEVAKNTAEITIDDIIGKKVGDDVTIVVTAYPGAAIVLYVDGQKLDSNIAENVAAGTHTIVASVAETDEYLAATTNKTFTVSKYDVDVSVSGTSVNIGEKANITVNANVSEGIVVVKVNDVEYSVDLAKNNTFEVLTDKVGGVILSARYLGNEKYNAKDAKPNPFIVFNKAESKIKLEIPENIKVGDEVTINVTTPNKNLEVTVNGEKQTVTEGKVVFTVSEAGIYNIVAIANETKDYFGETVFKSFEVAKNTAEITIAEITPKMVDDDVVVEVRSYDGAKIVVYIDGVKQTLADNKVTIKATAGTHTIIANVAETPEYLSASANRTFTVSKYDVEISVSGTPVTIGEKSTIHVDSNVSEGIVVVDVNGAQYSLNLTNGNTLEVVMNNVGSIPLTAKYLENYKFNAKDADGTIEVTQKEESSIIIQVDEVAIVGDEIKINVTTNGDNLTVTVLFNGEIQKTAKGNFTFTPQKDGVYTIIAKTTENDTVYGSENRTSFAALNRTKEAPIIVISQIDGAKVGEEITFTVEVVAGGNPIVKINDEIITPADGVYKYTPKKGGLSLLTVETPENEKYSNGINATTFNVDKKQATIAINVVTDPLVTDKPIKIDIESYECAEIIAYIDGNPFDWGSTYKYSAGDHLIIATVAENDEYLGTTANKTFTVSKQTTKIRVDEDSVIVSQKATIGITLPSDATGIVIININGTEYSLNLSESRLISIVMNTVGDIPFTANYLGDEKYLPSNDSNRIFVVDKKSTTIDIDYPSVIYAGGDVNVTVTSGTEVDVYLDGVKQTLTEGKFTIENISAGSHVIYAESPETSEFKFNSTNKIINVDKKQSEVSIALPETIVIGEDVEINVTSTSDAGIDVYVDGVKQAVSDGKVVIKATAGVHTIIASVAENDKYLASNTNKSFAVDKLDAQIAVSGLDITEGQNTTVTIDTELSEGIVVVKINDTEVAVDLAKAKSVDVQLNAPGIYALSASYLGNDIYNACEALSSTINVAKKQTPEVNVTIPEIKANETESVTISIPNATGEIHVIIDGVEEIVPLDENGNATYDIPKMSAGSHSVVIVYPGDEKNDAVVKSMQFTVEKQTSEANITAPVDAKEGENATVKVEIANATGEVAVIIDGVEHKVPLVNGAIEYPLENLSAGTHSVVVIYPGDETHDAAYTASSFDVVGKPVVVPIESKFSDITISENLTISIILKDENGNAIKDAPVSYTINGGTLNTVYTSENGAFLVPGENGATIVIMYEGNETIMGTNTTLTLNNTVVPPAVVRIDTKFDFTSVLFIKGYAVDVKAGEKGFEFITVLSDINGNPLANKTVQLAVNSKVYNQVTNATGGVHYFFNMVNAGRYTMTYIFLGDGTHNSTLSSACVDLEKKPLTIKANSKSFKLSSTKKYTISLSTIVGSSSDGKAHLRVGKKVTLTVNGRTYTGKTDAKGKVTFNLKISKVGKFIAKISVDEDNTYKGASKKVYITIKW